MALAGLSQVDFDGAVRLLWNMTSLAKKIDKHDAWLKSAVKNAMKRKRRLQGKSSQLSDSDLVEVLRIRKAKKVAVVPPGSLPAPEVSEEAA